MKSRSLKKVLIGILPAALAVATAQAAEVWEAKPATNGAPVEAKSVRIVKLGMEHTRTDDGSVYSINTAHRFRMVTNATTGLLSPFLASSDRQEFHDYDVDGDGITTNDTVKSHVFSLTNSLTPNAPWYDTSVGSQRFYGGLSIYTADSTDPAGFSEDGINGGEEGAENQPRRNWTYFNEIYGIYEPYRMYGVWLFTKEDFLNGGANYPVSLDTNSVLAHLIMRYHMGMEGFRWVVRNNDQFYISQTVYKYADEIPGETGGKVHTLSPLNELWAEYNPGTPSYHIAFNTNAASYSARTFTNITAVGYYMFKDQLIPGYIGHKWYTFDASAVVSRPKRPSEAIDMKTVTGSGGVQDFYMSTCEVPYTLWRKVLRLINNNVFCRSPRGAAFDNDGDMGSMDYPDTNGVYLAHDPNEPVTDVTLYDAIVWCNALSIQESREPVYYEDAAFSNVFLEVVQPPFLKNPRQLPDIYVKWGADGYRLPTPKEWERAHTAGGQQYTSTYGWIAANATGTTHAVGGLSTNALGVYDMAGNAWELVWPFGNVLDPQATNALMALGGDLHYPNNPTNYSASAYGDLPYDGNYNVGLRLVRRESGLATPDTSTNVSVSIPQWVIAGSARNAAVPSRQLTAPLSSNWITQITVSGTNFAMGTYEVTFAKWKPVYDWAVNNGYTFDYDGDLGSMDYWGWDGRGAWSPSAHTPDEPAAGMNRFDAMSWLNALSELEGRTPVYCSDASTSTVMRTTIIYRPMMTTLGEESALIDADECFTQTEIHNWPLYTIKRTANGYRLPLEAEILYASQAGSSAAYPWGSDLSQATNHGWIVDNSGLNTHPVGQKTANAWGFYDMVGNVCEMTEGSLSASQSYTVRFSISFMDVGQGYPKNGPRDTHGGLAYPDVGLRVLRQIP